MQEHAQPKVSVIVPVWNPGPGITRCIDSLLKQTLKDIELIFVDDCGTDGSMEYVRAAAEADHRVRILTNAENLGAGASRNAGIAAARGEYLSFIDADDYINAVFLERLYQKAAAESLDIAKGRHEYEHADGTRANNHDLNVTIQQGLNVSNPLYCLFTYEHQSALYRRAFLQKHGILYGRSHRGEDTTFLLKVCHRAESFGMDGRAVYHFCENASSLMHDMEPHVMDQKLDALTEQMDYIIGNITDTRQAAYYLFIRVDYLINTADYFAKDSAHREAVARCSAGIQEQLKRFSDLALLKQLFLPVRVLCEMDVLLPTKPFKLPWEAYCAADYLRLAGKWLDFLQKYPAYCPAAKPYFYAWFWMRGSASRP